MNYKPKETSTKQYFNSTFLGNEKYKRLDKFSLFYKFIGSTKIIYQK
jgi:hypothetical protein